MLKCIDLFAGAGGFSTGARQAGLDVVWAGNHWQSACDVHEANHGLKPLCQDLHQANWTEVPAHDILLASPSCQGHSPARGKDRPHHDAARATAWAVVSAAECHLPRAVVVENVPSFCAWKLFAPWVSAMEALGYRLSLASLNAMHFGVPQIRERVFIVARRDGKAFEFPAPTVSEPVPVREALDLTAGTWNPTEDNARIAAGLRPLVANTKARIREGRRRHGSRPFWIPYFGSNIGGWSLDAPIWTLTTRDRYAIIKGDEMRFLITPEARRIMGFPDDYRLTGKPKLDLHLLGNAVVPAKARAILSKLAAEL